MSDFFGATEIRSVLDKLRRANSRTDFSKMSDAITRITSAIKQSIDNAPEQERSEIARAFLAGDPADVLKRLVEQVRWESSRNGY